MKIISSHRAELTAQIVDFLYRSILSENKNWKTFYNTVYIPLHSLAFLICIISNNFSYQ